MIVVVKLYIFSKVVDALAELFDVLFSSELVVTLAEPVSTLPTLAEEDTLTVTSNGNWLPLLILPRFQVRMFPCWVGSTGAVWLAKETCSGRVRLTMTFSAR